MTHVDLPKQNNACVLVVAKVLVLLGQSDGFIKE